MIDIDLPEHAWRLRAACAEAVSRGQADHSWWWPGSVEERHSETALEALLICDSCPVKDPCRDAAEVDDPPKGVDGGIRGGLTGRARALRRKAAAR